LNVNRLRLQLILAFTLVVLVAVGAIAVLFMRTTSSQFRQYITHSGMQASGSGLQELVAYYEQNGSWDGVGSLLGQMVFLGEAETGLGSGTAWHLTRPGGQLDVLLADANGQIVYDSSGQSVGRKLRSQERSQALPITPNGSDEAIGYLLLALPSGPDPLGRLEQQFLDHMQQILVTGAALAVVVGMALGVLLSRSLTAPLQRLAAAARAVAAGDLTHRVRVEGSTEMVEVARAFNEMTAALAESERQRKNMVADVAHELRTPLSVVQGNLRAILDGVYPLDHGEIARVYDETRLLSRLVDDLRELALADAGQLRLLVRPTDLRPVIRSTIENLAPAAEAGEVALGSDLPDSLPAALADPGRVAEVLRNLVVNALRHTEPGGSVTVTACPADEAVEIAVTDTGDGIAEQDLAHVFERFWKADSARVPSGSTGLGLSIAQSLVEAQGGHIWAESTPGKGSRFRFALPVPAASAGQTSLRSRD
jgi:signal transduction histidine kinase